MLKKPVIILVIDNLAKGGAEMLLVGILKELSKSYDIIIVTLQDACEFEEHYFENVTIHNLNVKSRLFYPFALIKLRRLIKRYRPLFVHSHLVYSTILTRLACFGNVPLLFSVHNEIGQNVFKKSKMLYLLEKLTVKKRHTLIAVSHTVLKDYESVIDFPGNKVVLENYIEDHFYEQQYIPRSFNSGEKLRIVALGNVKDSKNYQYLVRSFLHLKDCNVSLDIYGNKDEVIYPPLQSFISDNDLKVVFKGKASNIPAIFSNYHLYIMSSKHEGFGIAAIEAMACKLPLVLSDLPVLREVTESNAIFFNLKEENDLADKIKKIMQGGYDLNSFTVKGIDIAKKYSKQEYLQKLTAIYEKSIHTK